MGSFDLAWSAAPTRGTSVSKPGTRQILIAFAAFSALRILLAATLPLSFDESYFWLWSRHLALSYYDHPPLIALAIRLGTWLFGDTVLGVRAVPLAASLATCWAVWQAGRVLFNDERTAAIAAGLLSVTLMFTAESLGATPDALVLAASAFLLWSMAKLEATHDGRWWLAAGLAAGAALLSKYTAFFLVASAGLWLLATPRGRAWLRTPWPYMGGLIAAACLAPNLYWNALHGWISFKFQFGRVSEGHFTLRYLGEFALAQLALASPFVLILGIAGLAGETRLTKAVRPLAFAAAIVWPGALYFLVHCLHDRVQGNWPSFVYPALCLLAAPVFAAPRREGAAQAVLALSRRLAFPTAVLMLLACYAQAFTHVVPLGARDPLARMTAMGFEPVARDISNLARQRHAAAIVTTKYVVTGWLSFYLKPRLPVVQMSQDERWLEAPRAGTALLSGPLLYVTQHPDRELPLISGRFAAVEPLGALTRKEDGAAIDKVYVYALSGFRGGDTGRLP
ncbi:MAG TPA: glycosyltransferase family 39 protein [Rhizomicrobium sp.]|nr:glycosyltransferase family 39 protein [Rhizomicrobium sp.]